ncbi:TPA: hypothetical protein HA281_01215 [Candidatus Woesearchaeota archaeon]|nr:MAG: hypothetical protein QT04_C0045G0028 [archaeon GW2011_AR11]MBS3110711.1 hypothetical protein [Candidatus Woesearchaeota archaeon]HIH05379.1 hypothetical protein [Candidatus Woesearchaeota archaeon]HIH91398.1 hypothetical protein [Candidatus Woesearchaeota archaeon]HII64441.1 hypothetical protein [Candidatus Woesearchaeota archaeon]
MAFSSKKGVSPLIATILLIAFAVALGTVIMNWGLSLGSSSDDPCAKVALELKKMVDNGEVCYGNRGAEGYLNFVIENSGSTDISGVSIWLTGRKKTDLVDLGSLSIPRRETFDKTGNGVIFDFSAIGNLDQVQFIPRIMVNGKEKACIKQAVQPSDVKFC